MKEIAYQATSQYTIQEIIGIMNAHTESVFRLGTTKKYIGMINENSFKIRKNVGFNDTNSAAPTLKCQLTEQENHTTKICFYLSLSPYASTFIKIWTSLLLIFSSIILIVTINNVFTKNEFDIYVLVCLFIMYLILGVVKFIIKRSIRQFVTDICHTLHLNPSQLIKLK